VGNNISVHKKSDIGIIICAGAIDYFTEAFADAVNGLMKTGTRKIVVDLAQTDYISSLGWGAIIGNLKELRAGGGDIRLAAMSAEVKNSYRLLKFDELMDSCDAVDDAIRSFYGRTDA